MHKWAMLMAWTNADRGSNLATLDLAYCTYKGNEVKFIIPGLTQTWHSGSPLEAFYPSLLSVPKLCPICTLQCHEKWSEILQTTFAKTTQKPLFFSVRIPHTPVKAATIGHWLKSLMKSAGINTDIFSAHSTCGAATSRAKAMAVPMVEILKAAKWSSTFMMRFLCWLLCAIVDHERMVSIITVWGTGWTGFTHSLQTDGYHRIKDNMGRYCPKTFETAKGKKERWCCHSY